MCQRAWWKGCAADPRRTCADPCAKCPMTHFFISKATSEIDLSYLVSLRGNFCQSTVYIWDKRELPSWTRMRISEWLLRLEVDLWHEEQELHVIRNIRVTIKTNPASVWSLPSVRGGIQGSTEYGRLSIRAHNPRIAEWSDRRESA